MASSTRPTFALPTSLHSYTTNVSETLNETFGNLTYTDGMRLLIVICGYILLRPHLIKIGARIQAKSHADLDKQAAAEAEEEERDRKYEESYTTSAKMDGNFLRGAKDVDLDTDSEEEREMGKAAGTDWGKGARKRQRRFVKRVLEAEEKRREEEDVEGIEDLLEE
ncbi:hypothetical protein MMC25_007732 [Agyrium rufum]|nr:hypothetical protein [Agyrium rufum]